MSPKYGQYFRAPQVKDAELNQPPHQYIYFKNAFAYRGNSGKLLTVSDRNELEYDGFYF